MEVRLYNISLAVEDKHEEMIFVKKIDAEMYKDLEFGGFIVIDDKSYRMCCYHAEKCILAVELVELDEKGEEHFYSSDFECPFCGHIDYDAWELDDAGVTDCSACGSEIEYERVVTVEYNLTPIKCAPVTKFN